MPRVLGIDPGTLSVDFCVLLEGEVQDARSVPTSSLSSDASALRRVLDELGSFDLIAAPSGYGLPLVRGDLAGENALRLAFLAPPSQGGGILGLRRAVAEIIATGREIVFLPGAVHLPTIPPHRKVNRVDMGTADKVCAVAVAVARACERHRVQPREVSLILVELGGAFTAVLAVERGAIVDGAGGTSGAMGFRAAGALDGEVAVLARTLVKDDLFTGGAVSIAGEGDLDPEEWEARAIDDERARLARRAYLEGVLKTVAALRTSAPTAREVILSGRLARAPGLAGELSLLARLGPDVKTLLPDREEAAGRGAAVPRGPGWVKEAALGAALLADGLSGGRYAGLVEALRIREASGTVLDHVFLPAALRGATCFLAAIT